MSAEQYQLHVVNQSDSMANLMIFQTSPDQENPNLYSLAWMTHQLPPKQNVTFEWTIDYAFVWGETGMLQPGVTFFPGQVFNANPESQNSIELGDVDGFPSFSNEGGGAPQGNLLIRNDASIPLNRIAEGIAMSGKSTFITQANPNMDNIFSAESEYWITIGNYQDGQVLLEADIHDKAQITFPAGVFSMEAILNPDDTWTIEPMEAVQS